jgi:nitrite reductase/ring-hydroxylating ferredoxin subunit/uncharacterized membrane protein
VEAREPSVLWRTVEAATSAVESMKVLDPIGRVVGNWFSNVVRPGALKDALSGTWLGHPAHPMLTDIPIGAWTSAFMLDVLGGEDRRRSADTLIALGLLAAVPTAIAGLSDFADVTRSDERVVGTAHAIGNVGAVTVYGIAYVLRRRGSRRSGTALSALGAALATGSGFLGGHLSFRKGLGVDHTAFDPAVKEWTDVLDEGKLPVGTVRRVQAAGTDVMVYRGEERLYALANRCSHRGGPLHKGRIEEGAVRCPWHLSTFRLEDGAIIQGPATAPQPVYEARIADGKVQVRARL